MSVQEVAQPSRHDVFLGRDWLHRYHAIRVTRGSDGRMVEFPMSSSISSALDFNPRWLVDRLVATRGATLFTLILDTTNACTDACPMCWTMDKRKAEGFDKRIDVDLVLRRLAELRESYPDTFKQVALAGCGEPLALPGVERLLDGIADLDLTVHLYTAGKHLRRESIRRGLLRVAVSVRASLDATDEETFQEVHQAGGLAERIEAMRALAGERDATGHRTALGLSMVFQKANFTQILPFARLARDIGCDFVTFHQETYGIVRGGFDQDEARRVADDLAAVEAMQDEHFAVNVPRLAGRATVFRRQAEARTEPAELNRCFTARHKATFGSGNDFTACPKGAAHLSYRKASHVGSLYEDDTMSAVRTTIEHGVGAALGRPAPLSCATCDLQPYHDTVRRLLTHLDAEREWDCELVPFEPGVVHDPNYELVLAGQEPDTRQVTRPDGTVRTVLPLVDTT